MLDQTKIDGLKSSLRGRLVAKGDAEYDDSRKVYNGMIDKHPALIAYCVDVADVIASVNFGRENNILIAVRGGGHSGGGLGVCNDGLVIDLSGIRYSQIDVKAQTIRAGAGSLLGDLDHAASAFGMATPSGIVSTTGVSGLTLGGGLGYLTRKFGLAIDNLLEADLVLADGSFVTASEKENPDLFWAIRGGGGNFGIATSFLFRLYPVGIIMGGPTFWDIDKSTEVLKFYREFMANAPEDLSGFFAFLTVPPGPPFPEALHNKKVCGIVWYYSGPLDKADEVFAPVKNFSSPLMHGVMAMPHHVLNGAFDSLVPKGLQWYWKADFINEISDKAIEQHVKYGKTMPTMLSTMHLYPIDGAASRISSTATPWNYRKSKWAMMISGTDPDPANNDRMIKWARDYWEAIHPYSAGGAYVNFMMDEGGDRVKASYGDNYDRLSKIKKKYDPNNLFRVNQNIKPA